MSDTPFLGEIRLVSFDFAPSGWAQCNGQLLPINSNQPLFSLLGTMYGGDGQVTFALPDLRGRTAIHVGPAYTEGQPIGAESATLSMSSMPAHGHTVEATSAGANISDVGGAAAASLTYARANTSIYGPFANPAAMAAATIGSAGGGQPHENRQPFTVLCMCIALVGIFPSRN